MFSTRTLRFKQERKIFLAPNIYEYKIGTELLKNTAKQKVARMNSHFIGVPSKSIYNVNFESPYKHSNLHVLVFPN